MSIQRPFSLLVAPFVLVALLFAGSAQAFPDFDSLNGKFSFSNFSVVGSVAEAENISIVATEDGFDIIMNDGAMRVEAGDARDLAIQYDVTANAGPIVSAALSFEGQAVGDGALATVSEDYFSQPSDLLIPPGLTVFAVEGMADYFDSQNVGEQMMMSVDKDILVTAIFDGRVAEITRVSQSFATAVPEPSAGLLFAAGAGIVGTSLRRRSRAHSC